MRRRTLVTVGVLALLGHLSNAEAQSPSGRAIEIGQTLTIHSRTLNEDRRILIHVPGNPNDQSTAYPVLYVLDGDEYFLPAVGIVSYLTTYDYLPAMLVVGIPHGRDRFHEYTPTKDARAPSGGGVDRFLEFVKDEVFPYIDTHYRTQPYRILSGHSLGGLCALYALVKKPEMFNAYVAVSSSVYWDNGVLLTLAEAVLSKSPGLKKSLYLSVESGGDDIHVTTNRQFARTLEMSAPRDLSRRFDAWEGENHTSVWVKSIDQGLRFVSPWNVPEATLNGGLGAILKHFEDLRLEMSESLLVRLALNFDAMKKPAQAIEVLEHAIARYPKSADLFHGLGDIWRENGQPDRALAVYRNGLKTAEANADRALVELFRQHIDELQKAMTRK